jgi:hypothetical protein
VGARRAGRGLHLGLGGVRATEPDVLGHRVVDQERVLEDERDVAQQGRRADLAHVDPADLDESGVDVVEAGDEPGER